MITILVSEEPVELTWEQWEDRVGNGRIPPKTMVQFAPVTGEKFVAADELEIYLSLLNTNVNAWKDAFRDAPPPLMCAILVGIQIRIWWLSWAHGLFPDLEWTFLSAPAVFEDGEVWRLITMGFLHMDIGHLISNMAVMLFVGWNLERALGPWNVLTIFVGSVIGGSLLSVGMSPLVPSIGASGGVFGLVAAATVFGFSKTDILPAKARRVFGWAILPYLIFMFSSGWMDSNIDNWAHLGGLLSGALLALVVDPPSIATLSWRRWTPTIAIALSGILGIGLHQAGPHILSITDSAPPKETLERPAKRINTRVLYRPIVWSIPVGWDRLQGPNGLRLYVSPQTDIRAWGVRVRKTSSPQHIDDVFKEWDERLKEMGAMPSNDAVTSTQEGMPTQLFEKEYLQTGTEHTHIRLRVGIKGLRVFESLWQTPITDTDRLEPLFRRLNRSVNWKAPSQFVDAQREYTRRPKNYKIRALYAMALLEWGQIDEAIDLFNSLIKLDPFRSEGWSGLIHAAHWYPDSTESLTRLTETILQNEPNPQVLAQLADALHRSGNERLARSLLNTAWELTPGHRALRGTRQSLGLSTTLHEGTPRYLFWNASNGEPQTPSTSQPPPLTLASLEAQASTISANAKALKGRILSRLSPYPSGATSWLIFASTGDIPDSETLLIAVEKLVEELRSVQFGDNPAWMDVQLAQKIRILQAKHPTWLRELSNIASALHIQLQPESLGRTIASGMGPQDLLRREEIQFLAQRKRSQLLKELGYAESVGKASLSDLRFASP